ncbi:tyrosine-type DNA invertase [Enterobacter ludwigii]|uniref:tyrosine-type DNA invertase n=1 Tax=Enterobacteriaceae TaxID=543 RepID=UPI00300D4C90
MKKRKYLTWEEVHHLLHTISQSAVPLRDYCMIYMTFLHGLRVSELTGLTLDDYDPRSQKLYIRRLKGGLSTTHPLLPEESHVLSQWLKQRQRLPGSDLPWLFLSRQGGRLSRQRLYALIRQYGINAQLPIGIHPHMLRHACGYALADRGNDTRLIQDYLGYRNIRHTVAYTASNAERFSRAWMTNTEPPPHPPHSLVKNAVTDDMLTWRCNLFYDLQKGDWRNAIRAQNAAKTLPVENRLFLIKQERRPVRRGSSSAHENECFS